jgi:hypothetical protein
LGDQNGNDAKTGSLIAAMIEAMGGEVSKEEREAKYKGDFSEFAATSPQAGGPEKKASDRRRGNE